MPKMELKLAHFPVESASTLQSHLTAEKQHSCSNCEGTFDKPVLVQYYACPHCLAKIGEELKTGCQHWFGYLSQKEKGEPIPKNCVECEKVLECMLDRHYSSEGAVAEIKKWY